ncbi:MAG: PaaX family transcriptional regulator C-terminal domain-containing protein [Terracoccus sp.]
MADGDDRGMPAPGSGSPSGSRTLVVSFLGAVVHRLGGWMPIGGAIELLTQAGLDGQSVRTAVFRLKRRGWLTAEARSGVRGYALTEIARAALTAGDEIIWHAPPPADLAEGWCIVSFSVPESARAQRHQLRSQLAALGFGNVGSGMWIAPARRRSAAERMIDELGLLPRCAIFVGEHAGGEALPDLVADSWDLEEIDDRYRRFIAEHGEVVDGAAGDTTGREAFVAYLRVVDGWRRLPYRDPGLPPAVLPPDWHAATAGELFVRLVAGLEVDAFAHARSYWPVADGGSQDRLAE